MTVKQKLYQNQNCLLVSEYHCLKCGFAFLTDNRSGGLKCPSCNGAIEALGTVNISQTECKHNFNQHGHQNYG